MIGISDRDVARNRAWAGAHRILMSIYCSLMLASTPVPSGSEILASIASSAQALLERLVAFY